MKKLLIIVVVLLAVNVFAEDIPVILEENVEEWLQIQDRIDEIDMHINSEWSLDGENVTRKEFLDHYQSQANEDLAKFENIKNIGKRNYNNAGGLEYLMPDGTSNSFAGEGGQSIGVEEYMSGYKETHENMMEMFEASLDEKEIEDLIRLKGSLEVRKIEIETSGRKIVDQIEINEAMRTLKEHKEFMEAKKAKKEKDKETNWHTFVPYK